MEQINYLVSFAQSYTNKLPDSIKNFNKLNLVPAIEREVFIAAHETSPISTNQHLNQAFKDDKIIFRIKRSRSLKSRIKTILLYAVRFRRLQNQILSLFRLKHTLPKSCKVVICIHHHKYIDYFLSLGFDNSKFCWLILGDYKSSLAKLPKDSLVRVLPRFIFGCKTSFIIQPVIDLAAKLDTFFNFSCVSSVVSFEGDSPSCAIVAELALKYRFNSVCIQWGIFYPSYSKVLFSNLRHTLFLVWGPYFKDTLLQLNPSLRIKVLGYPSKTKDSFRLSVPKRKMIVFLAQGVSGVITNEIFKKFTLLCREASCLLPDYEVLYRPHPSFRAELAFTSGIRIDSTTSLSDLLSSAMISVGITTSALVEGLLFDVIPISFNPTNMPYALPLNDLNIGFELHCFEDALNAIVELASADQAKKSQYIMAIKSFKPTVFGDKNIKVLPL